MGNDEPGTTRVLDKRVASLTDATRALAEAGDVTKASRLRRVLDGARLVLLQDGGPAAVQEMAADLEAAGIFEGTDWDSPAALIPALSAGTLRSSDADKVVTEIVSDLRLPGAPGTGRVASGVFSAVNEASIKIASSASSQRARWRGPPA